MTTLPTVTMTTSPPGVKDSCAVTAVNLMTAVTMVLVRRAIFLVVMTASVSAIFAQAGTSFEAEIQNIEKNAAHAGSAVERHDALVRLARLRQLSGDIEGAARNWLEAAAAIPDKVDDDALLACAYCLAAMGEWDRAGAALEPLLSKSLRARFLDTGIKAIKTGDVSALGALSGDPEYSQIRAEIIFMLWKISRGDSAETWRQRLVSEFPQSPEGRLAAGVTASAITVRPSPFWLFAGGLDSLSLMESKVSFQSTASVTFASVPAPQAPIAQAQAVQAAVRLQTGVFGRQANAETQMASLEKAGFSPSLEQRGEMWAVVVSPGTDVNISIRELKDAGFDSFPLR